MPKPKNAMEIFQRLDRSNCQACGKKTCLAFASAVFMGQKTIEECPKLDRSIIAEMYDEPGKLNTIQAYGDETIEKLKDEIRSIDLAEAAKRIGAAFENSRLTLKVLGKDFHVDSDGCLSAGIHINPWVAVPFLNYVLYSEVLPVSGTWVSFRELKDAREMFALFHKRCEMAMKTVADGYPDLFNDMVHIFGGRQAEKQFEADISVILEPLPKIPVMICYWFPEDGLDSNLNVYFDRTADRNLDTDSLFNLGTGLTRMFEKLAQRHGVS